MLFNVGDLGSCVKSKSLCLSEKDWLVRELRHSRRKASLLRELPPSIHAKGEASIKANSLVRKSTVSNVVFAFLPV